MERRDSDAKIQTLMTDVNTLKGQVAENTAITKEVKTLLDNFKALDKIGHWCGFIIKWAGIIAGTIITIKALLFGSK